MRQKKELNIQIGKQIRLAREKHGLTQEEFAEAIDKTPQFISDLERGVYGVSIETLKTICETLHISCDSLIFDPLNKPVDQIEQINQLLNYMTPEQLRIMEAITNAFLQASSKQK